MRVNPIAPGVETGSADLCQIELERFQGPLDLLLHLIRKQDIDVFDIPIARITGQFLAAIRGVDALQLERAGEFLEMASTLLRIKLRMLFPRRGTGEEEDEDPRADLVRRLLEYEHFREVSARLEEAQRVRSLHYPRVYDHPRPRGEHPPPVLQTGWEELWEAAVGLEDRSGDRNGTVVWATEWPVRVEEKIEPILGRLRESPRIEFAELVAPWGSRAHSVACLLACLELARRQDLRMRQRAPFAPLWILGSVEDG